MILFYILVETVLLAETSNFSGKIGHFYFVGVCNFLFFLSKLSWGMSAHACRLLDEWEREVDQSNGNSRSDVFQEKSRLADWWMDHCLLPTQLKN